MELGFACITGRTRSCLEIYLEHITGGNWIMVELGLLVELAFLKNVYSFQSYEIFGVIEECV